MAGNSCIYKKTVDRSSCDCFITAGIQAKGGNHMHFKTILLTGSALAAAVAAPAQAQDGAALTEAVSEESGQIIVTGSRIRRADIEGVGPTTVVTAEEIENTGIVNVETLLQRLPANAGQAGNQTAAYWTGNGWGTSQVNLRGLGIKRTLVLLNGRRLVAGGTGANSSPDLNMIPVNMLARTEVLKDGASAVYGADAVAGVVNLITRTDFEGITAGGRYGITDEGDGGDLTLDFMGGLRGERGGVMVAASYQNTDPINMATRAPCGLSESNGQLVCRNSASTIGGRAALPDGTQINFNQELGGDGDFYEPYSAAKHNYNGNPALNAVNPIERYSIAAFADWELTDSIQVFGEFLYTKRDTNQIATPGTLRNIAIAADNPINPTGEDILLVQRRLAEAGPRQFFQDTKTFQGTGGFRGDLSSAWSWEVAATWGRNTAKEGQTNVANLENVGLALDPDTCGTGGIPCADILGYGDLTPDVLDYLLFTSVGTGGNELFSVTADITGELFQLPAGSVGFASGVTYRKEKGWRNPDPLTVAGIANTNQQDPISGSISAKEAYAEVSIPVLADAPFAEAFTIDGALRLSDYDLFGTDWNYKLGADWEITGGLRLRATYGTGFRVPNVPELFSGVSEGNLTTTDPCSGYSTSGNATLIANCQASGVPAGYVQLGNTVLTTTGGNPDLQPESSTTWTLGAVFQPRGIVPGLTLTADWFDIDIEDAIRTIPGSTKLAVCYASENLSSQFCDDFTRSSLTGEVTYLQAQSVNAGLEKMSGLDLGMIYDRSIGDFQVSLNLNVTWLNEYVVYPFEGGDPIHFDGYIGGGNGGYPDWRGYGVLSVANGPVIGTWSTQWIGSATDFNADPGDIGYETPDVFYHNAQIAFEVNDATRFSIGVDNIFDRKAPYIQSYTDANTDTMTYDLMGRRFYLGIRTGF
ncbi:TonB-dependent receptor domain-containing protein [Croceicoccus sp. Ery5]|uniref:TonB-dependent receptor domain-containing protein n=1 Tax=Croceicoccus sp. Ery5 TaxID=1703340 RepID=UPI001E2EF1A7|nr:TonB-dependent receptor [Croceicoccus sp. Ery5]